MQSIIQAYSQSRRQTSDVKFLEKNSAYAQIGDVKTAIILTEFLVDKNKLMELILKTIIRLINRHFCSASFNVRHIHKHEVQKHISDSNIPTILTGLSDP